MSIAELFGITVSPWEIVIRGSATYWFIFLIFRFILRRDVGSVTIADVLLLVLIADAAQNALAGGYETISEGMLLVSTIVGWNYLLDWASYRFTLVRRLAMPPPLLLVRQGQVLHHNLRKELISMDELTTKLRQQGVEHVSEVRRAFMEADGTISVIRQDGQR